MFFAYRGEIVPRVSKSLGHEAGAARRERWAGSWAALVPIPGSWTRLSWLTPSEKMGRRRGAGF